MEKIAYEGKSLLVTIYLALCLSMGLDNSKVFAMNTSSPSVPNKERHTVTRLVDEDQVYGYHVHEPKYKKLVNDHNKKGGVKRWFCESSFFFPRNLAYRLLF